MVDEKGGNKKKSRRENSVTWDHLQEMVKKKKNATDTDESFPYQHHARQTFTWHVVLPSIHKA